MAKFKFRLQSFLDLKGKLEEQKKLSYGKAIEQLEAEKQKKVDLENEVDKTITSFKKNIDFKVEPLEFRQYNLYIDLLKKKIKAQILEIEKAEKVVEEKRQELVEAVKERKALDTLKEKDLEVYKEEEKRLEQKMVDEIVSYRYNKA